METEREQRVERCVHLAFQIGLWAKVLFALTEIAGGIAALLVTQHFLVAAANLITHGELVEDPNDLIANYLLHAVHNLSVGSREFGGIYLLSHGAVKLWLVVGLLRERLWYYPTALVVFFLFIVYQLYRFTETHSVWLMLVTFVDLVVIVLTWHEYRLLRGSRVIHRWRRDD